MKGVCWRKASVLVGVLALAPGGCDERESAVTTGAGGASTGTAGGSSGGATGGGGSAGALAVTGVKPGLVDPMGGTMLRITGVGLEGVTEVWIDGAPAGEVVSLGDGSIGCRSGVVKAGSGLDLEVVRGGDHAVLADALEGWSPAEIAGARVFDAAAGVLGAEAATTHQWGRLTEVMAPEWIQRDGPGLVWLPETGRFWMIGGWSPYDAPDGWGADSATTNEVWSSADGVEWVKELEHGNDQFDRRHFQGTLVWRDRVWLIGGDVFLVSGQYQHDIASSADGVHWSMEVAQTPWSDRIFEVAGIYHDQMWVVGGQNGMFSEGTIHHNDVWRSDDGVAWAQVAADAPAGENRWGGRGVVNKLVEFQDRLWLIGGGRYETPDSPERVTYAEVWSTTDGITWKQHAKPPWVGRMYHSVEVWDGKLWVIGGCREQVCNGNDAWFSEDGESWTEIPYQRSPLPSSHADGVAVGPDFLLFAGGNYTFGFGAGVDRSAWRLRAFHGTAVSSWVDRASGLEVTAQGAARPVLDPDGLGVGIPGLVFDGLDHVLELDEADIQPAGRSVFFVVQSPYNPTVASEYNPADTVVGDSVAPFCGAGLSQGALAYTEGSDGQWKTLSAGRGYQDGVGDVVCLGVSHAADGTVQAWGDGVAVGDAAAFGYTADYEGWRTIGAGYGLSDRFVGAIGAVVVLPAAADAATAAKIHEWAQGRFLAR